MKTKILITSISAVLASSMSFANKPIEHSPIENSLIENKVLGRQFCENNKGHLTGLGFKKNGIVHYIDSLAGMPNPYTFFKVQYINGSDQFTINEYSKDTNEVISQGTYPFKYDLASDSLQSEDVILTTKKCKK